MKIVFKQNLTEKTNTENVIKQYEVKTKQKTDDKSTKWKQKEILDLDPERFDDYYPSIAEMFPE